MKWVQEHMKCVCNEMWNVLLYIACTGAHETCTGEYEMCTGTYEMCIGAYEMCTGTYKMCTEHMKCVQLFKTSHYQF